jgi:hypothetical protein
MRVERRGRVTLVRIRPRAGQDPPHHPRPEPAFQVEVISRAHATRPRLISDEAGVRAQRPRTGRGQRKPCGGRPRRRARGDMSPRLFVSCTPRKARRWWTKTRRWPSERRSRLAAPYGCTPRWSGGSWRTRAWPGSCCVSGSGTAPARRSSATATPPVKYAGAGTRSLATAPACSRLCTSTTLWRRLSHRSTVVHRAGTVSATTSRRRCASGYRCTPKHWAHRRQGGYPHGLHG